MFWRVGVFAVLNLFVFAEGFFMPGRVRIDFSNCYVKTVVHKCAKLNPVLKFYFVIGVNRIDLILTMIFGLVILMQNV